MRLLGRAVNWLITALMALLLLSALCFVIAQFALGWVFDPVLGEGMDPVYEIGDVAIVKPVEPVEIKEGDVIVYYSPLNAEKLAHRVTEVLPQQDGSYRFRTKGDAGEEEDPYVVVEQNIEGRADVSIPLLGYMLPFVKTPLGFGLMFVIPGIVLLGMETKSIWITFPEEMLRRRARWSTGLKPEDWVDKR